MAIVLTHAQGKFQLNSAVTTVARLRTDKGIPRLRESVNFFFFYV